jgi:hypothetical protein
MRFCRTARSGHIAARNPLSISTKTRKVGFARESGRSIARTNLNEFNMHLHSFYALFTGLIVLIAEN